MEIYLKLRKRLLRLLELLMYVDYLIFILRTILIKSMILYY